LKLKDDNWKEINVPKRICTEDVALMLSDIEIHEFATDNDLECEIFINPGKYLTHSTSSFVFQKDFVLKEAIDYHLLKFEQTGLLKHLQRKYIKTITQNCQSQIRELSFRATFFIFVILASGVVIAMITFTIEKFRYRFFWC